MRILIEKQKKPENKKDKFQKMEVSTLNKTGRKTIISEG